MRELFVSGITKSIQTKNTNAISLLYAFLNENVFGAQGPAVELKEFLGTVEAAGSTCLLHRVFDQRFQSGLVPPNSSATTLSNYPYTTLGEQGLTFQQRSLLFSIGSLRSFDHSFDNGVSCNFNNDVLIKPGMPAYGPLFFVILLELARDNKKSNNLGLLGSRVTAIRSFEAVDRAMTPNIRTLVVKPDGTDFELGNQPLLSVPLLASIDEMMFIAPYGCRTVLTAAGQGPLLNVFCKRVQDLHTRSLGALATSWKRFMEKEVFKRIAALRPIQDVIVLEAELEGIFDVAEAEPADRQPGQSNAAETGAQLLPIQVLGAPDCRDST